MREVTEGLILEEIFPSPPLSILFSLLFPSRIKRALAIHFCSYKVLPEHMELRVYGVQHRKPRARIFLLIQVVYDGCFAIMLRQLSN